jgi:DNA-binding response OmpR family regulator
MLVKNDNAACQYLPKPFELNQVQALVEEICSNPAAIV